MHVSKIWLFAGMYVLVTLVILFLSTPSSLFSQKLSLFYKDPHITDDVHIAIIDNPNGRSALLTRFFHNKVSFSANNLFLSLVRPLDPVFFFSLFQKPYYDDSWYTFTSPLYFPFFLIGAVTLIRKWDTVKKKYQFFLWLFGFSLIVDASFIPDTAPLPLIPLFMSVQLVIFFGCYELIQTLTHVWVKK